MIYKLAPNLFHFLTASCSCSKYIDVNGYGKCLKPRGGNHRLVCYVNEPSSCSDLVDGEEGKRYSYEACSELGEIRHYE